MDMRTEPENVSPASSGIGHIVENSERTLNGFESDDYGVTDESCYVSSKPHPKVEFEGGSDTRLSNSQSSACEQALYVEPVPKSESPFVAGVGCVVESSEDALDGFEREGYDMTDESCYISSRPHPNVEFEEKSDSHLSNSSSFVLKQAPYEESVREDESPFVTGIGHIVEGSERTLDGFEIDGNDVTDESCEFPSTPLSGTLPYFNSNECGRGPEGPQALQFVSSSQSVVNKSYVPHANSGPLTLAVDTGCGGFHLIVHHQYN
jgi:hypothetical protein